MNSESKYSVAGNRELLLLAQSPDTAVSDRATDQLIRENMGLVRSVSTRFIGRGVEFEDLVQIGTIGMLKAIRTFDLSRGTAFSTYAVPLILGEIRRHLRDEGPIKVGRAIKRLGAELMQAQSAYIAEHGYEPGITVLADAVGVSAEEASSALDAVSPVASLSEGTDENGEGLELYDRIPDSDGLQEIERARDRIAVGQAIRRLPPLWRQIVVLRYYRGLTQQKTADLLGLSQVKVSREEKKIVEVLRSELT